jgi:hypothetical protein
MDTAAVYPGGESDGPCSLSCHPREKIRARYGDICGGMSAVYFLVGARASVCVRRSVCSFGIPVLVGLSDRDSYHAIQHRRIQSFQDKKIVAMVPVSWLGCGRTF